MSQYAADQAIGFGSLVELLQWRACSQPEQCAYTFLVDGESEEVYLTYAELDRQAQIIAARLRAMVAPGERTLLLYPPGLEFIAAFFGCLYAGVIAVPAYPPHPARLHAMLPRLQAIAGHAQAAAVLTTAPVQFIAQPLLQQMPALAYLRWLTTDRLGDGRALPWQAPAVDGETLAFVQYTSGSTAAPKGVMVSHGNLLHNLALIYRHFEHTPDSRGVIWLPPYHDMGLIGGVLQPLYGGFPVTLMSPSAFLMRPLRWLQALSNSAATTSGGPNFAYDLCVRKTTPEQRATLDLSHWEVAFCGAEPVHGDTLERFAAAFAQSGFRREAFYPCYGLAEATLFVTGGLKSAPPVVVDGATLERRPAVAALDEDDGARALVGCGQAPLGQVVAIVDPESCTRRAGGEVGEIWVSGPSVAHGYLHQADETVRAFRAHLADTGEGPFLRTGDLGFFHEDELFVSGRLKDLIIIGGRNHHPEDIEHTVEGSHPALQPGACAAFSVDIGSEERLVIAAELKRSRRFEEIGAVILGIRQAVAERHDLRVHDVLMLKPAGLPKTSSGKVQRHACRAGFVTGTLNVVNAAKELKITAEEVP